MGLHGNYFWKKAPFVKILLAFMTGIALQWQIQPVVQTWLRRGFAAAFAGLGAQLAVSER